VAEDLIADGEVHHAMLGIQGSTVTEEREEATVPLGVGVTEMTGDSAYRAAGGEMNDVIVALAEDPVASIQQLIARLRTRRAGEEVQVRALRGDRELTLAVELGEYSNE
jgi:S1-C subfamily serine protease